MAEFGSDEHIKSLSREKLEDLFLYVFDSRNDLNVIITMQSKKIYELYKKVANQSKQLKGVQTALERRNCELDKLKAENTKLREELEGRDE